MTFVEDTEEVIYGNLRVICGGKGPPQPPSKDWLKNFEQGQWFLAMQNGERVDIEIFVVVFKWKTAVRLQGQFGVRIVDSEGFSRQYKLVEILDKEELNGNAIRPDRPSELADDADAEGRQSGDVVDQP